LVHQRFSTNTFPSWGLAHPFRMICHNGEINTLRGNINWIRARQGAISSPILGEDLGKIWPLIYDGQSDSASFDNALELLMMGGYSVAHAMMMMIPEAWEQHSLMDPQRRAFYEYHAAMMEPWDGPASIAFTDGRQIGATLDRNGLRPSRYIVTDDDLVIMGSECGCLPVPEERVVKKWRLQPGKMFLVDLEKGRIVDDKELKDHLAGAKPYAEWIERIRVKLDEVETEKTQPYKSRVLAITYPVTWGKDAVEARLASLAAQAEDAVRSGYSIIVISDRLVDRGRVAIPALLALSAIHQHLVGKGLRTSTGLVVETGSTREVHHFALLGGYGAEAVHPYLALETLLDAAERGALGEGVDGRKAVKNFVKAIGKGLKKVMSKMGTSTYMS